jgi:hypothetical protein
VAEAAAPTGGRIDAHAGAPAFNPCGNFLVNNTASMLTASAIPTK